MNDKNMQDKYIEKLYNIETAIAVMQSQYETVITELKGINAFLSSLKCKENEGKIESNISRIKWLYTILGASIAGVTIYIVQKYINF